jgi:predicted metal-dependent hydrolase
VNEPLPLRSEPQLQVRVQRSARRKRSVGARLDGDMVTVVIPTWMSAAEEAHWVQVMHGRYTRARSTERFDLPARAAALARRFELPAPDAVRWSDDMLHRWASCTPGTRTIRVSTRVANFPDWVVDYVIVHELAHFVQANHSPAFWELVARYPLSERARGYLIAKSGDGADC